MARERFIVMRRSPCWSRSSRAGIVVARGDLAMAAVVAYEVITAVVVMVLVLLAEGFQRSERVRAAGAAGRADVRQRAGVRPVLERWL